MILGEDSIPIHDEVPIEKAFLVGARISVSASIRVNTAGGALRRGARPEVLESMIMILSRGRATATILRRTGETIRQKGRNTVGTNYHKR